MVRSPKQFNLLNEDQNWNGGIIKILNIYFLINFLKTVFTGKIFFPGSTFPQLFFYFSNKELYFSLPIFKYK